MVEQWRAENKNVFSSKTLAELQKLWLDVLNFLQKRVSWSNEKWSECAENKNKSCYGQIDGLTWSYSDQQIEVKSAQGPGEVSWQFQRKNDDPFFTHQVVTLRHQKISQTISLHLYPTSCGE